MEVSESGKEILRTGFRQEREDDGEGNQAECWMSGRKNAEEGAGKKTGACRGEAEMSKHSERGFIGVENTEESVHVSNTVSSGTRRVEDGNDEKVDQRRNCNCMEFEG